MKCCTLPDVPIARTVYVPGGVEFPFFTGRGVVLLPQATKSINPASKRMKSKAIPLRWIFRPPNRNMPNNPKPGLRVHQANTGLGATPGTERSAVVPVVLMVTVTAAGSAPGVTEAGLTVQVENAGTPAQTRVTELEKVPPTGLIDSW